MLALAAKKSPKSQLYLHDITNFDLGERFDVIICPFDTINHITTFSGWKRVFNNARRHLNSGGIFIFDVNTEHKMESYTVAPEVTELSDDLISIIEVKRSRKHRYEVVQRLLTKKSSKSYALKMMTLPELIIPTPRILKELSTYFRRVTMIDPEQSRPNELTEELYFVCARPVSS
jgi:SAM-dependent methyltransferase